MPAPLLELANDHLDVVIADDCSATITDKSTGKRWDMLGVAWQDLGRIADEVVWTRRERVWADYFIGRFHATRSGQQLRVDVLGPPWTRDSVRGSFTATWELDGPDLKLGISDIDQRLPSLNFQPPIRSQAIVQPSDVGLILRDQQDGMNAFFSTQNNGMNMRWIGGLAEDEQAGWMTIFEEGYEDSGIYRTSLNLTPCWLQSKGRWAPLRSCRYRFVSDGYVEMCRIFRRYLQEQNAFRTLAEKLDDCPDLARLRGGRVISSMQCYTPHARNSANFMQEPSPQEQAEDGQVHVDLTHAEAAEALQLARQWGMRKGLMNLRGTWHGGYDEVHPDVWPPEPALGSIEELRTLIDQPDPYLVALHDNYQDMYDRVPSFPRDLVQTSEGLPLTGGHWHGGLCYIICSTRQRAYAERNWPQISSLGMKAHFIDTASCVRFYECHHPEHPMTRREDREHKLQLMQFFKDQGLVLGSEEAADYGLWHIDWLENRHVHVPRETPPLWSLVFHDAAFYCRYSTQGTSGGDPSDQLPNWLWGYMSYWPINNLEDWRGREASFKDSLPLDALHERIGCDEMVDHRYLDDGMVEQTEFSSGVSVLANFADEERVIDGLRIAAGDKLVLD
ncbi:MAG: hypothetical protein ACOCXJ_01165 [Planctomycetota bacterium]